MYRNYNLNQIALLIDLEVLILAYDILIIIHNLVENILNNAFENFV